MPLEYRSNSNSFFRVILIFLVVIVPLVVLFLLIRQIYQKELYKPLLSQFVNGRKLSLSDYRKLYRIYGINIRDKDENTLLHRLTMKACFQKISPYPFLIELLKKGLSPNERNAKGQTPIHLAAAYCRDEEVLKELLSLFLKFKGDINARDCAGNTPLFYTIDYATFDSQLKVLLRFKPDVNTKNYYGWTPLCKATLFDLGYQFSVLQRAGADVYESCGEISIPQLAKTLKSGHVIYYLEKLGIDVKNVKEVKGNVKRLLFNPLSNNLCVCVRKDFESNLKKVLTYSIIFDEAERVKAFYEHSLLSPRDKLDGRSPVLLAATRGLFCSPKVLDYFITAGFVKPNEKFKKGKTLLHICAGRGCDECVRILVKRGARVDVEDNRRFTPYCEAVANGREGTAEELLRLGANPDAPCVKVVRHLKDLNGWLGKTTVK